MFEKSVKKTNVLPEKTPVFAHSFAARRVHFTFFLLAGFFVMAILLNIGKDPRAFAGLGKSTEGLFKGFIFSYVNTVHFVLTYFLIKK